MKKPMTADDWKLIALLILWFFLSLPWIKKYGSGEGAIIGGCITAALWCGFKGLAWLGNRKD